MKKKYLLSLLFLGAVACLSPSCQKNGAGGGSSGDQLPDATTIGANTFGCMVNGQVFVPHGSSNPGSHSTQCNYIYTNGGYYLTVAASNDNNSTFIVNIGLNTNMLSINEGQILKLEDRNAPGKACGLYSLVNASVITYQTTAIINGQLHITKFDQTKQIVSGTFNFDAIRTDISKSDTIHVTDGRFDMKYTQ
jgi:hypothetical protein